MPTPASTSTQSSSHAPMRTGATDIGLGRDDRFPRDACVPALIASHAAASPTRIAVVAGGSRLTYAEIDRRTADLAGRLLRAGVTPGSRVAICLPRGSDQVVAVMAVFAAGAAFVPLDPAQPDERLAWMLADARAAAVIAAGDRVCWPLDPGCRVIRVDERPGWEGITPAITPPLPGPLAPEQTAYVIYTSGSTGRPKGVAVSHRGLMHSTDARRTWYRLPVTTFLLCSTLAFDSAMAGLFWTLCDGGTLVLPDDGEHADPVALRRLIEANRVTHLLCLPSLYAWLIESDLAALASLRVAIVAGETCPRALAAKHHDRLGHVELHNEYGPTECSVWSTAHESRAAETADRVPIGRPIPRARIYVARRPWELAPPGAAGEGLIGGEGVADGYVNRPDLTAERFLPDPWSDRPGARLYRTGDRLRWLADGSIDFLGRLDRQVKVRGHRIELEEIEAAIASCAGVRECAVLARDESQSLEAYVVADAGLADDLADRVRASIASRLPGYMTPSAIVVLPALPRTPNGKIDRQSLASPAPQRPGDTIAATAESAIESAIAALWREVLGREQIGHTDNFFDLGGHSLMAIEVYHRLHTTIAPQLRLVDLFSYPTVRTLAAFLTPAPPDAAAGRAVVPEPDAAGEPNAAAATAATGPDVVLAPDVAEVRARQQALGNRRRRALRVP